MNPNTGLLICQIIACSTAILLALSGFGIYHFDKIIQRNRNEQEDRSMNEIKDIAFESTQANKVNIEMLRKLTNTNFDLLLKRLVHDYPLGFSIYFVHVDQKASNEVIIFWRKGSKKPKFEILKWSRKLTYEVKSELTINWDSLVINEKIDNELFMFAPNFKTDKFSIVGLPLAIFLEYGSKGHFGHENILGTVEYIERTAEGTLIVVGFKYNK